MRLFRCSAVLAMLAVTFAFCPAVLADGIVVPEATKDIKAADKAACSAKNLAALKESLSLSSLRHNNDLWNPIRTLLCSPKNTDTIKYVESLLARKVEQATSDLDNNTRRWVPRSRKLASQLLEEGILFDASLSELDGKLTLTYSQNDVCVRSRTFSKISDQWRLTRIGEGCDWVGGSDQLHRHHLHITIPEWEITVPQLVWIKSLQPRCLLFSPVPAFADEVPAATVQVQAKRPIMHARPTDFKSWSLNCLRWVSNRRRKHGGL